MGLIAAALGSASGVMADQWKEYFYCEALPENVLLTKGYKRASGRSTNTKGFDNIITTGSVIAVADGQCMIIVEQGKVVDLCAVPGEYTYDAKTEPSLLAGGSLIENIKDVFANIGKRFTFGGEPPMDQRIYYINTKEVIGNKYGTANPVPFRVVDERAGIDIDVSVRCFGEYSYHIIDPTTFYTNLCGNVTDQYTRDRIDGQMKSEMLSALQEAFAKISEMGVRYSQVPGHTSELADALNEVLSKKWSEGRGIEMVSVGVSSITASPEDEAMLKEMQKNAAFKDPSLLNANMAAAKMDAMKAAAKNEGGAAMAFMGMNMADMAGGNNAQFVQDAAVMQQKAAEEAAAKQQAAADAAAWVCEKCGAKNTGKFCTECGAPKPVKDVWTCAKCGHENEGKFCTECGSPRPAAVKNYKCSKCGWEPEDPTAPPKFCPQCGKAFGDEDIVG